MLVDITISNFRSIKESQTISFEAIRDRRLRSDHVIPVDKKLRLLKFGAVIGANGTGKSVVVRAMEMLQAMVLAPEKEENPLARLAGSSFAYDADWRDAPSSITIQLVKGRDTKTGGPIIYCYTLEADMNKVHREILTMRTGRSTSRLFERTLVPSENSDEPLTYTYSWGKKYIGEKKRFGRKVPANHLFLGAAGRAGSESLQNVYRWFRDELIIVPVGLSRLSEQYIIDNIRKNPELRSYIVNFLAVMDVIDIRDVRIVEKDGEEDRLVYVHGVSRAQYASYFSSESLGTRRLSMMAVVFWQAASRDVCLIADDFGLLLHEKIVQELYSKFSIETAYNGSQLLTAGVELTPLQKGQHRYDEIWLTSKMIDGSTNYYSLSDYNIRKNDQVKTMYLNGAFGALPILFDSMQDRNREV